MSYPPQSPDATVARLSAQLDAARGEVRSMSDRIDDRLDRIERQTTATNGRVGRLEEWRIAVEATNRVRSEQADREEVNEHRRFSQRERWMIAAVGALITIVGPVITALILLLVPSG